MPVCPRIRPHLAQPQSDARRASLGPTYETHPPTLPPFPPPPHYQGLDTIDILLVRNNGRATGEAFVVLVHPAEMEGAMRKHKAYMGSRYIEVLEARKPDYYNAVCSTFGGGGGGYGGHHGGGGGFRGRSRSRSPPPGSERPAPPPTTIVKLRGLPFSASVDDIAAFFADPTIGLLAPNPEKCVQGVDRLPVWAKDASAGCRRGGAGLHGALLGAW